LTAALIAASCLAAGSCSSSGSNNDKFMGTWTFDTGSITGTNCTGLSTVSLQGETLTLTKGTMSDLSSTLMSSFGTCTLNLNVMGTVASATAGQTCIFTVAALGGLQVTFGVDSWTVTTTDGMSMTTAATASGQGLASGCTLSLIGAGTKHAGSDAGAGG
jgi:hypothetical protein